MSDYDFNSTVASYIDYVEHLAAHIERQASITNYCDRELLAPDDEPNETRRVWAALTDDERDDIAEAVVPDLPGAVDVSDLGVPVEIPEYDARMKALAGSDYLWGDYEVGERIDHVDGMTIEESDHMLATRLYQNTAKVHFNQFAQNDSRIGRRLIYGGHIISLARALSFNGLANAHAIAAINAGSHSNPTFAGHTIHAWSEVLERLEVPGRADVGALRLRTVATKDRPCADFPYRGEDGKYLPDVVLDLDYTVLMPRR